MAIFRKRAVITGNVHWSKDYVEHLRTVHFTLIAVVAGLITLVLTAKRYDEVKALTQVEEILALKNRWATNDLFDKRRGDEYLWPFVDAAQSDGPPNGRFQVSVLGVGKKLKKYTVALPSKPCWVTQVGSEAKDVVDRSDLPKWISPQEIDFFPANLSEFEIWWNAVGGRYRGARISFVLVRPRTFSQTCILTHGEKCEVLKDESSSYGGLESNPNTLNGSCSPPDIFSFGFPIKPYIKAYLKGKDATTNLLSASVNWGEKIEVDQSTIIRAFELDPSSEGFYKDSFRDLSIASQGLESLPLSDVRVHLATILGKGPDVFEAFGIKILSQSVSAFGIVAILCIQLYLLVYLMQLVLKLGQDDPGWDVPWIGMNDSILGRMIFFVTVVVLPFVGIGLLYAKAGVQAIGQKAHGSRFWLWDWSGMTWTNRIEGSLLVLCLPIGLLLSWLCWLNRPRVKDAGLQEAEQIFE